MVTSILTGLIKVKNIAEIIESAQIHDIIPIQLISGVKSIRYSSGRKQFLEYAVPSYITLLFVLTDMFICHYFIRIFGLPFGLLYLDS